MLNLLLSETNPPSSTARHDAFTIVAALEYIKVMHPRIIYISFSETDAFAHAGKYARYLDAAQHWDRAIAMLWKELQMNPQYREKTGLIVATDHGRGENREWITHGKDIRGTEDVWMGVYSPDIRACGAPHSAKKVVLAQVAATAAALLGEDYRSAVPAAAEPLPGVTISVASSAVR